MGYDDKESSGIVCVVSRQAGTVAGTSVVISKKIAGCGVKTVTAAKDLLKRPLRILTPTRDKRRGTKYEASTIESRVEQETGRKDAAKALITALELKLASTERELEEAQSDAAKTQSKLASQIGELKVEKETLLTKLEHAKSEANEATIRKSEVKTRETALESDLSYAQPAEETPLSDRVEEKVEVPSLSAVTEGQVQTNIFSNATEKVIFTKALSDIASQDIDARINGVKAIGSIRHVLSIKALVTQLGCETSPQVRQECVKALTRQEENEGLRAVKCALTDEAASVRLAAVWGLYRLAGAESASDLVRMVSDEDEEVRRRSATCIGWLRQEELAVELLPLLSDKSACVRRAAIEAMGNLRSRQVISTLIEHLNDPEKSIRKVILEALKKITGKRMNGPLPRDEKTLQCSIARWREWWKEELLG